MLEVHLDLPGLDFSKTYLVPLYEAKAASSLKPVLLEALDWGRVKHSITS